MRIKAIVSTIVTVCTCTSWLFYFEVEIIHCSNDYIQFSLNTVMVLQLNYSTPPTPSSARYGCSPITFVPI